MTTDEALTRWGLPPAISSLDEIRHELNLEIERRQHEGTEDLLLLLCVQLFAARQPEDALHIWRAKQCDFDAFCYIEGDLICGAGVEATRQFLRNSNAPEATAALEWLGDEDGNEREDELAYKERLTSYQRYFRPDKEEF